MVMSAKWSIPPALLALGLLIKTTPVGPGGKRTELLLPASTEGRIDFSDVATATPNQGSTVFILNSRHLNADNTHYVVPLRTQKVPRTLVLSDTIEAIDVNEELVPQYSPSDSRRKAVGRRLLRAIEYGWMSGTAKYSTPDEDLLLILIGLSQAVIIRDDVMGELEAAMSSVEKEMEPDYWWRNL
jgi:hypothetical protein